MKRSAKAITLARLDKTKREMAEFLRKVLATEIKFEKLSKKDLARLYNLFKQADWLFLAKLARKAKKEQILTRYPLLRRLDGLTDVLIQVIRLARE